MAIGTVNRPGVNQHEVNQQYLVAALDQVRAVLERYIHSKRNPEPARAEDTQEYEPHAGEESSALDLLTAAFRLSPFERAILVLCAGVELDSSFAELCTAAQGDPARTYPTFSLALAALPQAHWSALNPSAPLRRWRLIEVLNQPGASLTTSPLKIDERILHFLANVQHLDERLTGLVHPVYSTEELVPSHEELVRRIVTTWARAVPDFPLIQLCGTDEASRRAIAVSACTQQGLQIYGMPAEHIPTSPIEVEGFIRLWEREAILTSCALYVDAETIDDCDAKVVAQASRMLQGMRGPILLSTRERWRPLRRSVRVLDVRKPTLQEQHNVWTGLLGETAAQLNGDLNDLVAQFNLPAASIRASVAQVLEARPERAEIMRALWDASCSQARPRLADLAQRIEPIARWNDLVLPRHEKSMLREIALHVRHRSTVYGTWGFGALSSRGLGVSALFSGASGTGKTMAAEVLANELRLDLYRIDLSGVVSKYIGETEKNLRRVFDAAEDGGAILFFDEADALFGKRSEVKDSHDRYANIEINYLLQRMESYRGLAMLATNMRSALDPAFLRRLRFVVNFPFPDAVQRAEIWQRVFPQAAPTGKLDLDKLARLDIPGGNIRNIALHAAFLAAGEHEAILMSHLARAARSEFAKIDKPAPEADIASWI